METAIQKICSETRKLPLKNGCNQTDVPFVTVYRFTEEKIQMPPSAEPYIYLVLDGTLRLHTPAGIMDYTAGQYSVSKIDTPEAGTVLCFSDQRDFLALAVELTVSDVITTVLKLDNSLTESILNAPSDSRRAAVSDRAVAESVYKLFSEAHRAVPSEFIQQNTLRGDHLLYSLRILRQAVHPKYCEYAAGRRNIRSQQLD